jgi:hypothetical protein
MLGSSAGIVTLALLVLLAVAIAAQAYSPGQRLWVKTYGTAARQAHFSRVATGPGGVACAVGQQGRSGDDDRRGVVVKYSAAGRQLWARNYPAGASTDFCALTHVAFDAAGNVYVLGQRQKKGSQPDLAVVKYSPKGTLRWSRLYDGPAHSSDFPGGLAVDAKGFVYASCSSQVDSSTFATAVRKYDSSGRVKWTGRIAPLGASYPNRDLALDASRNVYVVGEYSQFPNASSYVVKLSGSKGSQLGSAIYRPADPAGNAYGNSIAVRGSTVVVGGYGYAAAGSTQDALVAAYTLGLVERYPPLLYDGVAHGNDAVFDVALDARGNAFATGDAYVRSPYADAAQTFKVSPLGTVVWADSYLGASDDAEGESIVVDGTGNAYVAGYAANAAQWDNLLVAKYAAGPVLKRSWLKTWGGEYNADDAWSIVLGAKGTLYVACQGQTKVGVYQGVVARYAR